MPGYKALPSFVTGDAADQAREAESRHRAGDSGAAIALLEAALAASVAERAELPGWLCGRLAALYRTSGRYDDEVRLLERYRDSQRTEDARTRYDARLCKARTIAERKRRSESGALASVRASIDRPRTRRRAAAPIQPATGPACFSDDVLRELRAALADDNDDEERRLRAALECLCEEARASRAPAERLVEVMKEVRDTPEADECVAETRRRRYGDGLMLLFAIHFQEAAV
jgi:hypothetical protein